jgi:hypothetical protein
MHVVNQGRWHRGASASTWDFDISTFFKSQN